MRGLKPTPAFKLLGLFHRALIVGERQEREIIPVLVVREIKDSREAGSSVNCLTAYAFVRALVPVPVRLLVFEQPADALSDAVAAVVAGGEQPENGPCRLRWRADANTARRWVVVAAAAFAPTAVGVLHHANPLGGLLDLRLVVPDADGFESAQNEKCAVDIVDAPASKPTAVRLLFIEDELDSLFDALVFARVAIDGQHLQNAPGNVDGRRIEHRVMIGKRDVLEDHLRVVFIEAGPAAIPALHGEYPVDGAQTDIMLIALARVINLI